MYIYTFISLIFITSITFANEYKVSATGVLNSGMTPEQLTNTLRKKLKIKAITLSPYYVEHLQMVESSTTKEDIFDEKIISLNAGLVELRDTESKWLTGQGDVLSLKLSSTALVDISALKYQIANLRRNKRLEVGVSLAVKELEKLQLQIDNIDQELDGQGEHGKRQDLAKKREHLISKILEDGDTSTLYHVADSTKKRLLLTHDLFNDKSNALNQGHKVGVIVYNYLEKNLIVSAPKLSVKGKHKLDISFTYGFDPLPIIGLLERYYVVVSNVGFLSLTPKFSKGTYEGDVITVINNYLNAKVGAKVSTTTKWKKLLVRSSEMKYKGNFKAPFQLFYGHGGDLRSSKGEVVVSMELPMELIANPVGLTVGKSI